MADLSSRSAMTDVQKPKGLPLRVKMGYGVGDFGQGIYATLTGLFLNAFLLDVAGLRPSLVGVIFGLSLVWDSITDPLVGALADRTRTRWGRKRPWLLLGAIPFGLSYVMLWQSPNFGDTGNFIYILFAALFWKNAFTAVSVPYSALTPDLTRDYDEQVSLNSYRFRFSIFGSLIGALFHTLIVNAAPNVELGHVFSALTWAFFMTITVWVAFASTKELPLTDEDDTQQVSVLQNLRIAFSNRPYLTVAGIYMLAWLTLQFIQNFLFLYLRYWSGPEAEGQVQFLIVALQGTAFIMLGVWVFLGKRFDWVDKKRIYYMGAAIWAVTQFGLFFVQPGQIAPLYLAAILAGVGLSAAAYLVPWSMLPDVIDYSEWKTGVRHEGIYYGLFIFLQKLTLSGSIAMANLVLENAGYVNPLFAGEVTTQPDSVLLTLRLLVSWVPLVTLLLSIPLVMAYPISRKRLREIQAALINRKMKPSDS